MLHGGMDKMEKEYIIEEGIREYKMPNEPKIEDYYDLNETEEERKERICLYSEVK